jgi:hypothetical protein
MPGGFVDSIMQRPREKIRSILETPVFDPGVSGLNRAETPKSSGCEHQRLWPSQGQIEEFRV